MSRFSVRLSSKRTNRWLCLVALFSLTVGCVEQAEDKPTKEDEAYIKKNLLTTPPKPEFVVNANLDDKVIYLGMDVRANPVVAGKDVTLTHYWKVLSPPGDGWKVFTHLGGPNKQGFANVDHVPMNGKYPASMWKAGQIIRDQHTFRPPASWTYDHLVVYTGLYKGQERMPIKAGPHDDGRVICGSIPMNVTAHAPLKRYVVTKVSKRIKIDGKLDEQAWKDAPSTGLVVDTLTGKPGAVATEAKLLWDNHYLYVAFVNQDTDIWSTLTARDSKLWTQEADELMIDADGNGKTYVELQVAPNGTIFDAYLPTYRKYEDSINPKLKPYSWNSKVKVAVKVDGTLNKRDDQDKSWTVEMALPLADANGLDKPGVKVPPAVGDMWRINMFRLDSPKGKPQIAVGWSPPLVGDFHKLDRFGEIVFGDEKGQVPQAKPAPAAKGATEKAAKEEKGGKEKAVKGEKKVKEKAMKGERGGKVKAKEGKAARKHEKAAEAEGGKAKGAAKKEGAKKAEAPK